MKLARWLLALALAMPVLGYAQTAQNAQPATRGYARYHTLDGGTVPGAVIECARPDGSDNADPCGPSNPDFVSDGNSASFTSWPVIASVSTSSASPTSMPTGYRVLGYTCSAATAVTLLDGSGNALTTTLPAGGFHSFTSEVPSSFYVTGTNACVFNAER